MRLVVWAFLVWNLYPQDLHVLWKMFLTAEHFSRMIETNV